MPPDLSDTSVRLCAQVVGWYHSHPTFKPNPSEKDIENQENFQALFRDEGTKQEPFVDDLPPYDVRLLDRESRRETFWVRKGAQGYGEVGPLPCGCVETGSRLLERHRGHQGLYEAARGEHDPGEGRGKAE